MEKLTNKRVVIITGASTGLGRAMAEKLANRDTVFILCARNIKKLTRVCHNLKSRGAECYPSRIDVSKKVDITNFIKKSLKRFSKIDILINNAGAIHKGGPIEKISDKEFDLCMRTNFDSVFYALRETIPAMKKQGSGVIITISSTASRKGNPNFAAYSASKFAVAGLMQSTAGYLGKYGIRCITIFPAGINTAMRKYILGTRDANKQQTAESVAKVIETAIINEARFPNGSEIEIREGKISKLILP